MVMCFYSFLWWHTSICSLWLRYLLPHLNHLTELPNPYVICADTVCLCSSIIAGIHPWFQVCCCWSSYWVQHLGLSGVGSHCYIQSFLRFFTQKNWPGGYVKFSVSFLESLFMSSAFIKPWIFIVTHRFSDIYVGLLYFLGIGFLQDE